ncbi:MAG TPA: ribonuclease HII [Candidatus Saccharimonadales bacterium]|jgi:ribonuclease HII|nr:ribonuclease HII [Candidatus Saccharimonadales bacterium]
MLVGIDEVGRGCLAGPLCVAAVALGSHTIEGLTDSKMLTKKRREILSYQIKQQANGIGIGWISAKLIDEIGMSAALKRAATTAVRHIQAPFEQIIIDGTIRLVDDPRVITMKKADLLIPTVSAASIIAKVARDAYMTRVHSLFPDYGFADHVGYGTAKHFAALRTHGPSPLHRMSFAPLTTPGNLTKRAVIANGQRAENEAAEHLQRLGYKVVARNWKTKICEIDIIATKHNIVHFIEVKYRTTARQGRGFDYITQAKQRQMRFAAELWSAKSDWKGESRLAACQVSGPEFTVTEWLPNIA